MMKTPLLRAIFLGLTVGALEAVANEPTPARPGFNRDIRPILSDACFHCHGPDQNTREAGLRLDVRDDATSATKSGAVAIVPGYPEKSEVVRRIFSTDEDDRMPPDRSHKSLTSQAFNENKRFDQFTLEQLADDLLPNATVAQRVATGFNRNHMINEEGGVTEEEFLANYTADRVETTATVWLAQTFNCARCHDHKFDPLTQRDFYSLKAFFHNVSEKGAGDYAKPAHVSSPPFLPVSGPDLAAKISAIKIDLEQAAPGQSPEGKARVAALTKSLEEAENAVPVTLVMDNAMPRDTFILLRGAFDQLGEKVTAATPAILPPMSDSLPRNRLLARGPRFRLPGEFVRDQALAASGLLATKIGGPSVFTFHQHGQAGHWLSELLPHTARLADDLCIIRSMNTEAINHDPAMTMLQTGSQVAGRPSFGSWLAYGLGSENADLPAFVVMISRPSGKGNPQPLHERMWGAGFLSARHQGVRFSPGRDPVLFLANSPGITPERRRAMLDDLAGLNKIKLDDYQNPEIQSRIDQYEMAFRMQSSVPELADLSKEPASAFDRYGPESRKPGTFAANCMLARRLAERGVRFIQLYHRGWDQHSDLPEHIRTLCYDTDQPGADLVEELKERGLLDETLVIWGGEFGRSVYSQGQLTATTYGRDHHPRCFSLWLAGGGIKRGALIGETDDFSYNVIKDPVPIHDLNATALHLLGIDHTRLTVRHQGRDYRLTDVHGNLIQAAIA